MKYISLDGNLFKDVAITHKILKEKLELPDYYGVIIRQVVVIWENTPKS